MPDHLITRLEVKGFKSIREADVELGALNVLIGENGSGKSNFVEVFRLMRAIGDGTLQNYVVGRGSRSLLHLGTGEGGAAELEVQFPPFVYEARLEASPETLVILDTLIDTANPSVGYYSHGAERRLESRLLHDVIPAVKRAKAMLDSWVVYHFHDTSANANCRGFAPLHDYDRLRAEGENLAAYLYRLKTGDPDDQKAFDRVERLVRLGLPFFDRFVLNSTPGRSPGNEDVLLRWRQKGSDFPFTAQHLSDGSLRYILLTTALNQPKSHRPTTMVIDEPELGLHPKMLGFLAGQIRSVAATGQVIVATQSSAFLDEFSPEDIVVVDRIGAESRFRRLPLEDLKVWLDEYTLSDLVWKGVIGGESSVF